MAKSVRYKNKKTGSVVTYAQPMKRLEKSPDWQRLPDEQPKAKGDAAK